MPPSRKRDGPPDDTVLSPEELDFSSEDEVAEIDEGRFVIRPDASSTEESAGADSVIDATETDRKTTFEDLRRETQEEPPSRSVRTDQPREELTGAAVKQWIGEELTRTDSQYAYRIAAKTGNTVSHQQLASDDIGMAFDGLLMWYAQQVGGDTAVEEALGILLAESNIRVRYPITGMLAFLDQHDLDPDDSIADLLAIIRQQDGLVFPLRSRR